MVKPVSSRAIHNLLIPLLITILAAFFGMFLPITAHNSHNVVWELFYGLGFYVSGFVARGYVANAFVGWVGLLVWPLIASSIAFLVARLVMRSSRKTRAAVGILFAASLFACVSHETENYLSSRGAPLYWNLYAAFY
jgi:hypothetical protein